MEIQPVGQALITKPASERKLVRTTQNTDPAGKASLLEAYEVQPRAVGGTFTRQSGWVFFST